MAARPPEEPPESIILGQFQGIRNTVERERLQLGELEAAVNVDIDDAGQVRRRRGYALVTAGNHHSLRETSTGWLVVKDNYLGTLNTNYVFTSLGYVGPDRLSYAQVGDVIYFSSATASGKIVDGAIQPWGYTGGDNTWLSPVVTPTDTLGEISGKLLHAPPVATNIEAYKGRIYLGAGQLMWATELHLHDYVDKTRGFYQFERDITMIRSVDNGLYVGTEGGLYFMQGTHSEGLKQTQVSPAAVIRGSDTIVPAARAHPASREGRIPEGDAVMLMTVDGICAAFDGGEVHNITRGRVVFPGATDAAALYREDSGATSYVAVANSGGSPAANARVGDFVDAEIRRFSGG